MRSQETEKQEDSYIPDILTISSSFSDIFLAILYISDNKISDRFFKIITCCAKLLESYWPGAMQLIRNCMSEMRAKLVIVI